MIHNPGEMNIIELRLGFGHYMYDGIKCLFSRLRISIVY